MQDAHVGVGVLDYEKLVDYVYDGADVVGAAQELDLAIGHAAILDDFD